MPKPNWSRPSFVAEYGKTVLPMACPKSDRAKEAVKKMKGKRISYSDPEARLDQAQPAPKPRAELGSGKFFQRNSIAPDVELEHIAALFASAEPMAGRRNGGKTARQGRLGRRVFAGAQVKMDQKTMASTVRAPRLHPALSSALPAPTSPRAQIVGYRKRPRDQDGAAAVHLRQGKELEQGQTKWPQFEQRAKTQFKPRQNRPLQSRATDRNGSSEGYVEIQGRTCPNPTTGARPDLCKSTAYYGNSNTARFRKIMCLKC